MELSPPLSEPTYLAKALVSTTIIGPDRRLSVETSWGPDAQITFGEHRLLVALQWVRAYSYLSSGIWQYTFGGAGDKLVTPPHGENLLYVARHDQRVYDFLKETVSALSWRLRFDQAQRTFRLSEVRDDEILDYNLDLLSDSL
jgi:hypothetical protein